MQPSFWNIQIESSKENSFNKMNTNFSNVINRIENYTVNLFNKIQKK